MELEDKSSEMVGPKNRSPWRLFMRLGRARSFSSWPNQIAARKVVRRELVTSRKRIRPSRCASLLVGNAIGIERNRRLNLALQLRRGQVSRLRVRKVTDWRACSHFVLRSDTVQAAITKLVEHDASAPTCSSVK